MRRISAVVASVLVIVAGCSRAPQDPQDGGDGADLATLWREDPREPYPFSGRVPPQEPTPVDGSYTRDVPVAEVGEPVPCARCAPYKIYAGEARLELDRGRFYVDEDGSQFGAEGHFVVEGTTVTLFNDPICPGLEVTYEFTLDGDVLHLDIERDPCAWQNLRGKYLTRSEWRRAG